MGENPERNCGLEGWPGWSVAISPGAGIEGSLICRFMRIDRRRPDCGEARCRARELVEEPFRAWCYSMSFRGDGTGADLRLEFSCWRPAFMVAAAWRDVAADRGEPVGDSPRGADAPSPLVAIYPNTSPGGMNGGKTGA